MNNSAAYMFDASAHRLHGEMWCNRCETVIWRTSLGDSSTLAELIALAGRHDLICDTPEPHLRRL